MFKLNQRKNSRLARKRRIRAKISGTALCPRLSVFRSLRSFSAQAIDDEKGLTLASVYSRELKEKSKNTVEAAGKLGSLLADRLKKLEVNAAVLDRSGYRYHGKVKAFTEALREKGIQI